MSFFINDKLNFNLPKIKFTQSKFNSLRDQSCSIKWGGWNFYFSFLLFFIFKSGSRIRIIKFLNYLKRMSGKFQSPNLNLRLRPTSTWNKVEVWKNWKFSKKLILRKLNFTLQSHNYVVPSIEKKKIKELAIDFQRASVLVIFEINDNLVIYRLRAKRRLMLSYIILQMENVLDFHLRNLPKISHSCFKMISCWCFSIENLKPWTLRGVKIEHILPLE